MLLLAINSSEFWDPIKEEFITIPDCTLKLEHSLVSVAYWEAKYKRAFLSERTGPKTIEEILDYIRFMSLNDDIDPSVYFDITEKQINKVEEYIQDPATATTFKSSPRRSESNFITSEIIYWQMITLGIPIECEKWNLNRLLTLIRVCDEKGMPPKKMSQNDVLKQYAGLNAKRRMKKR